jgi:phenylpyruvate tautomerase PptA (4-oxalocrotonate tautomerase family)
MPIYQCFIPAATMSDQTRAAAAEAITEAHCAVTSAPRGFVRVIFVEYSANAYFTAGRPDNGSVILGNIRAGRDRATRAELLDRLAHAWTSTTGQDIRTVVLGLNDIDPTSAMEAGLIMPAPGDETQWLQRHHAQLGALLTGD